MFTGSTTTVSILPATSNSKTPSCRSSRLRGLKNLRSFTDFAFPSNRNSTHFAIPITGLTSQRSLRLGPKRSRRSIGNLKRNSKTLTPNSEQSVSNTTVEASSTCQSSTSACVSTVEALNGLSRLPTQEESQGTEVISSNNFSQDRLPTQETTVPSVPIQEITMKRNRAEVSVRSTGDTRSSSPSNEPSNVMMAATHSDNSNASATVLPDGQLPTIKFVPHLDPRSARPSLKFPAMTRMLPNGTSVIRVGRYSERDSPPIVHTNQPSSAPVGFKSKVVSRRHCEFWCSNGQWYIRDVKSSSGTFLNHIRLSQPGVESGPWPVNDGDVVQLGIDFRGGEEMIFRCVKIRIECNRGWQSGPNKFNKSTYKRLQDMTSDSTKKDGDTASTHTSECSICLMSIAPCQSLFVAPCSHVWHYKCIRPILSGPTWPNFLCPNCRAVADLEADVDESHEASQWEDDASAIAAATSASVANNDQVNVNIDNGGSSNGDSHTNDDNTQAFTPRLQTDSENALGVTARNRNQNRNSGITSGLAALSLERRNRESTPTTNGADTRSTSTPAPDATNSDPAPSSSPSEPSASASATVRPRPILAASSSATTTTATTSAVAAAALTASPPLANRPFGTGAEGIPHDGPLTPRNDVGPFVLDGAGSGPNVSSVNSNGNTSAAAAAAAAAAGGHTNPASEEATARRRSSVAGLAQAMFGRRASSDHSPWRR